MYFFRYRVEVMAREPGSAGLKVFKTWSKGPAILRLEVVQKILHGRADHPSYGRSWGPVGGIPNPVEEFGGKADGHTLPFA